MTARGCGVAPPARPTLASQAEPAASLLVLFGRVEAEVEEVAGIDFAGFCHVRSKDAVKAFRFVSRRHQLFAQAPGNDDRVAAEAVVDRPGDGQFRAVPFDQLPQERRGPGRVCILTCRSLVASRAPARPPTVADRRSPARALVRADARLDRPIV